MKIAICDDDKQELLHNSWLVDEYLSCAFSESKIEVKQAYINHSFQAEYLLGGKKE
ncbi:MAG TPA: hypothetical protein VIK78_15235 [Ruminiclostridium sp.]